MIGHIIMEIEPDETCAAVAYYFNRDLFDSHAGRERHKTIVTEVRQRSNSNFIIEFDGWRPAGKENTNERTS